MLKWVFVFLLALFLLLQYQLWFGDRGFLAGHRLAQQTQVTQAKVDQLQRKNKRLTDKIERLKKDPGLVEAYARRDLGMVKEGEVFYRFDPQQGD
jgi:cell division protein FtsB